MCKESTLTAENLSCLQQNQRSLPKLCCLQLPKLCCIKRISFHWRNYVPCSELAFAAEIVLCVVNHRSLPKIELSTANQRSLLKIMLCAVNHRALLKLCCVQ
jgi:hypothetical protein